MQEIEKYKVKADNVETYVRILGDKNQVKLYELVKPRLGIATIAFMDEIKNELITDVAISVTEIINQKSINILKEKFTEKAVTLIKQKMPNTDLQTISYLTGILIHDMLGLGDIEFLLNDPYLEEIVINSSKEPIKIYHKKYGWVDTNITVKTEEQIQNYTSIIARRVGRQITTLNPLLDAHLVTGDRANAVLFPVSTKGNTLIIRKFAGDPWTVTDFITNNTCTSEVFALIWEAIQYEFNVLISGGTASGKTSLLNVCMPFIPPNHRIISIEDTRELSLPEFLYWSPLVTRQPNPEGKGEVSMLDLLVNSLRMRPDRIVLGEIRRKEQAQVLFEAMHTGHSVYSTVHADTISETIQRLINPPIEVPPNLLSAVNLNLVMFRDRKKGLRRVYQVGEFIVSEEEVHPNILYRWKPENDKIVAHVGSIRLMEDLSRFTGLTIKELLREIETKKTILNWMSKNNFRSIGEVGKIMNEYYSNQEKIEKLAKQNSKKLDLSDNKNV
ncbi:type II/IV secretion system ATPase subunit [Candidatus Woesearchaeota archaeon]|nr:type II/IV secretion system ATPase subunit [Candidatus Woesearchaeota archaeon]